MFLLLKLFNYRHKRYRHKERSSLCVNFVKESEKMRKAYEMYCIFSRIREQVCDKERLNNPVS